MKIEKVFTNITNEKVMLSFLKDITTPRELKALQERLDIVLLLRNGISYSEISKKTGASSSTITRVARFLNQEKYGGYRWLIKNINKIKDVLL